MKHIFSLRIIALVTFTFLISPNFGFGAVFTVSSTSQGPGVAGSILDAINSANANPDRDSIVFAVAGPINMNTTINITNPVVIDGYTSASPACGPSIRTQLLYNGGGTAINVNSTSNVTIRGLVISGSGIPVGININNSTGCKIEGNYIGITPNGLNLADINIQNNSQAIWLQNSSLNTIGGPSCRQRNVVSNYIMCVEIKNNSNNNTVINNYLGTDYQGKKPLIDATFNPLPYNTEYNSFGVHTIENSQNTKIFNNVIGSRRKYGIFFDKTTNNVNPGDNAIIQGNIIGIGTDSVTKMGNGWAGIFFHTAQGALIGGPNAADRNYSGNNGYLPQGTWETVGHGHGIQLSNNAGAAIIQNNVTGLSQNGKTPMPNAQDGISLLGSSGNTIKNNISEWNTFGIFLQGQLDYSKSPPPIWYPSASNVIVGNTVKYNGYNPNNLTEGGGIGVQFGASNNSIGLDVAGSGNLVDSNVTGILLRNDNVNSGFANLTIYGAPSNKVFNNTITRSTPNSGTPKFAAMSGAGLVIHGDGSDNNIVGGAGPNQFNTIINNASTGVYIETGVKNYVYPQNKIYCNGGTTGAQAIKLAAKPASAGVIGNNNYGSTSPVAGHVTVNAFNTTSADASDSTGALSYLYKGYAPANSRLYIYMADNCATCSKGSGFFKQGISLKDSLTVPATGIWSYSLPKPVGNGIVVYAVEPAGVNRNVSEFSQCYSPLCNPPASSSISPASPSAVCKGNTIALKASGGKPTYIYTWFNGATALNGAGGKANDSTFNANTTGSYTVRIADPSNPGNTSCYKTSAPVTITIDTATAAGAIGTNHSVCSGQTPQAFTSIAPATGGNGAPSYQWQSSTDNITFTNIAPNGTSATYAAPSGITVPTYYRRNSTAGTCPASSSNTVKVAIDQASAGGNIAATTTTICSGSSNGGTIKLTNYKFTIKEWQSSKDNFATAPVSISNTTDSLAFSGLKVATSYRAMVYSGSCPAVASATVTVKVDSAATGGTVTNPSGPPSVCTGTNSGTLQLTNYRKTIKRWEFSTDNFVTKTPLANTTATLNFNNLKQSTQYRAIVSSGTCSDSTSASYTVIVDSLAIGGKLNATSSSVCQGTNTGTITLNNYKKTIKRWEASTDNFVTPINLNTVTPAYTFTNLNSTTQYRVIVSSGACLDTISLPITINVDSLPKGGKLTNSVSTSVCSGNNSGNLTLSGYRKAISGWESSTDNFVTKSSIANTTTTLSYSNLSKTTQFRALVTSGTCTTPVASPFLEVVVDPISVGGTAFADSSNFCGTGSTTLQLKAQTGTSYQWQVSQDNNLFTNIGGATGPTYATPVLTQTTYYRAQVGNKSCSSVPSAIITVTISTGSIPGTVSGTPGICANNSTTLTLTGFTGSVQWESADSTLKYLPVSLNGTTNPYTSPLLNKSTHYHAVVKNGACKAVNTNDFLVIVKPVPSFSAGIDTMVCEGNQFVAKASPGFKNYHWDNGPDSSSLVVSIPGNYTVHALALNNCPVSATINVGKCKNVTIYNVITPTTTPGFNDKFVIQGNVPNSSLAIYNRWGTVMYTTEHYDNNWDGSGASDGTYFYIYKQPGGNSYTGYLEIVR